MSGRDPWLQVFFSCRNDAQIVASVADAFEVLDFHVVPLAPLHFQSLTLRRKISS